MPWTPTSRVIWLRALWMMCWSRERSKQSREEGGRTHVNHTHGRTRTHSNTHAHTHTCPMFSPAASTVCFSQGLWQRDVEQHSHSPPPPPSNPHARAHTHKHRHKHTHGQAHTCTHFSPWFRDDTSGWVWSVSKGLWLLFSTTHTRTHKPHTLLWRASVELGTHPVWRLQSLALLSAV